MLSKMSMLLAATAVALSAGAASAAHYNHHRGNTGLTIGFGDVAFGYNDGYWDNGHRWHRWHNSRDYHSYRDHGSNYHRWNHDRDRDNGWRDR